MRRFAVTLTGPALSDLYAIRSYIARDHADRAARVARSIMDAIDSLRTMPNRGRPGSAVNTRELVIPGWPWIVVYEVAADRVTVLRVLHAAQKSPI